MYNSKYCIHNKLSQLPQHCLEISTFFIHLLTKKKYPKFQNLIRPHFKTTLPQAMKQTVLSHHKVYILNVQLESLQLQEFIFYWPHWNINVIHLVQDISWVVRYSWNSLPLRNQKDHYRPSGTSKSKYCFTTKFVIKSCIRIL